MNDVIIPVGLWPQPVLKSAIIGLWRPATVEKVEAALEDLFPTGHAVLTSSGRVALVLALRALGLGRTSTVALFPYASHCVIDAIGLVATPVSRATDADVSIAFHQWGLTDIGARPTRLLVEDAVDTLCRPRTPLFPLQSDFEIWSLPKILGITTGGVLWCRSRETAEALRRVRDSGRSGTLPWLMRLASMKVAGVYDMWRGVELGVGRPGKQQCGEILHEIQNWDAHWLDRANKLALLASHDLHLPSRPDGRLGPLVPIQLNRRNMEQCAAVGLDLGPRHVEVPGKGLVEVQPVPVHQGVRIETIKTLVKNLNGEANE